MNDLQKTLSTLSAEQAAKRLLGAEVHRTFNGILLRARIVETEAYDENDPASHTYTGPSVRNQAMFGPAGHAYVYRSYGIHWCFNVTAGKVGFGAGVLVRAVEPLEGLETMMALRPQAVGVGVTNGPAKLTQALAIDDAFKQHDLSHDPLRVELKHPLNEKDIIQTTRIGITKAADVPHRFYVVHSPFISKK